MNTQRLLKLIEENGNLSHADLAVMLGETEEDVSNEVKRLEKENIIKAYRTVINWDITENPDASALIEVSVTPQRDVGFDDIATRIMEFSEVQSVYLMAGGYDLAVIVRAKNITDVAMFVRKRLSTIDGVLSTATRVILTKYKDQNTVVYNDYKEIDERETNLCD